MAAAAAAADADGGDGLEVLHGHLGQVARGLVSALMLDQISIIFI